MNNPASTLAAVINRIDAANAADPNRESFQGSELPKEILYARRMSARLDQLEPHASDALRIAAHGQHICRWLIPRDSFPAGRAGYHRWRLACQNMHAEKLATIMAEAGCDDEAIGRVQSLVRKQRLKLDPEAQLLEDVACLVFLEYYFDPFARGHDQAKLIDIVRKTWKKMSARGQNAALQLPLSDDARAIVQQALAQPSQSHAAHEA